MPSPSIPGSIPFRTPNYQRQEMPGVDDFVIRATEANSAYIQAAIETGRNVYPNLETYIQMAELIMPRTDGAYYDMQGRYAELINRSIYPAFLRDASPFEIFKVYQGPGIEAAILLIHRIADDADVSVNIRQLIETTFPEYVFAYFGFVRRGTANQTDLTPTAFLATITPDQAMLMEAWRTRRMTETVYGTQELLDLRQMQEALMGEVRARRNRARRGEGIARFIPNVQLPKHYHLGFTRDSLRDAVLAANDRIPQRIGQPLRTENNWRENRISNIIVDHIRHEGETAIDQRGEDRRLKKMPISESFPKEYYMMLYNELIMRGVITDAMVASDRQLSQLRTAERAQRKAELRQAAFERYIEQLRRAESTRSRAGWNHLQ